MGPPLGSYPTISHLPCPQLPSCNPQLNSSGAKPPPVSRMAAFECCYRVAIPRPHIQRVISRSQERRLPQARQNGNTHPSKRAGSSLLTTARLPSRPRRRPTRCVTLCGALLCSALLRSAMLHTAPSAQAHVMKTPRSLYSSYLLATCYLLAQRAPHFPQALCFCSSRRICACVEGRLAKTTSSINLNHGTWIRAALNTKVSLSCLRVAIIIIIILGPRQRA